MSRNWNTVQTAGDWMRQNEKRMMHQERRPHIAAAADLLGPGFGATAIQIADWNMDEAAFNGTFYSAPGAINGPDANAYWLGHVLSEDTNYGVQLLVEGRSVIDPPREYVRRFYDPGGGGSRTYSAWTRRGTPPGTIQMFGAGSAPAGWLLCNGASLLRAGTYADLFGVIGTTYGSVDGTHFTLPTFTDKFARGNTPGLGGGSDTHTNVLNDSGAAQIYIGAVGTNAIQMRRLSNLAAYNASHQVNVAGGGSATTGTTSGAALSGSTGTGANVPAYTGVAYIIRY